MYMILRKTDGSMISMPICYFRFKIDRVETREVCFQPLDQVAPQQLLFEEIETFKVIEEESTVAEYFKLNGNLYYDFGNFYYCNGSKIDGIRYYAARDEDREEDLDEDPEEDDNEDDET